MDREDQLRRIADLIANELVGERDRRSAARARIKELYEHFKSTPLENGLVPGFMEAGLMAQRQWIYETLDKEL